MLAPSLLVRRLALALAVATACAYSVSLTAQIPTRNVNMVAGLEWPGGDPFLQRQNEPSIAASTRNPMHLLGGSNDYRSVDLPVALSESEGEIGDAWLGLYKSTDAGDRWSSTLLPGYPQDPSPQGQASPIFGHHAAADPVVRAGTNGLVYYAGLAFDRAANERLKGVDRARSLRLILDHAGAQVDAAQFDAMLVDAMQTLEQLIVTVVAAAGLRYSDIDVVIRTGGSSQIVAVKELLERCFPGKVTVHDPFTSVAGGLAIASYYGY